MLLVVVAVTVGAVVVAAADADAASPIVAPHPWGQVAKAHMDLDQWDEALSAFKKARLVRLRLCFLPCFFPCLLSSFRVPFLSSSLPCSLPSLFPSFLPSFRLLDLCNWWPVWLV